jgi:hypothetical protein
VAAFTRVVEVLARVPQLLGVFPLHDVQHLKANIPQGLDPGIPLDRIFFDLRRNLVGRKFHRAQTDAVIDIAGRRERSRNLQ